VFETESSQILNLKNMKTKENSAKRERESERSEERFLPSDSPLQDIYQSVSTYHCAYRTGSERAKTGR
jgi:hypothetical protein